MHQTFSAETEAGPRELFDLMADLRTYPNWLDLVSEVEPTDDDGWLVTLRARVGPFSRSKRLRMVRTVHTPVGHDRKGSVRFERREIDGKNHSDWVLAAVVEPVEEDRPPIDRAPMESRVELDLVYDGALWSGLLDGVLHAAADRATAKLQDYVSGVNR